MKQIKGHSAYYGCDKCSQKGHWFRKMAFPEISAPLRIDSLFSEITNEEHHSGISPFSDLPLGMVTQFPINFHPSFQYTFTVSEVSANFLDIKLCVKADAISTSVYFHNFSV